MCGINGMVFLKGYEEQRKSYENVIKYLLNELMVETQDRGHHATGLAVFNRDGSYNWYKAPYEADFMTTYDDDWKKLVDGISPVNTSVIVGHTRYYTKGKPENNKNNHPFDIGNIVGVHNGSVKNDDELFKKHGFERIGEVDSEVIFHLINQYNEEKITYSGLKLALEDSGIMGLFALAFVHKLHPEVVHLVKQEKPLDLIFWKDTGIIIFNSVDEYIHKAFHKTIRAYRDLLGIELEIDYEYIKMNEDTYIYIDSREGDVDKAVSSALPLVIESSSKYTYNYSYYGGTSYTKTTYSPTKKSDDGKKTKPVVAKDKQGRVIKGEIDEATGEVFLKSYDGLYSTDIYDDGSGLADDDDSYYDEICFDCGTYLTEAEKAAPYNKGARQGEKLCHACYEWYAKKYYGYGG